MRVNFLSYPLAEIEGLLAVNRDFLQDGEGGKGAALCAAELCGIAIGIETLSSNLNCISALVFRESGDAKSGETNAEV